MNKFSALFQEGNIGTMRLKNRLIMPAMGNGLADGDCNITQRMLDYYRARAKGGVGLIVTQSAFVTAEDTFPYDMALYDDSFIPGLKKLVDVIHEEGARVSIQLMHWGMLRLFAGYIPEGVSIKVPSITSWTRGDILYREIDESDIDRYVEDFIEAAHRVKQAGADAIELHACHGCLVSSFLSPATNRRTDKYGGSIENRARLACRILEGIKEKIGSNFPVVIRINGNDDVEGGITIDEMLRQSTILESAGADAISITVGHENWSALSIPCYAIPAGIHVSLAEKVKKVVKVPVITAGKIEPELAEQIIKDGMADFVAMGRPLMADPDLPNKLHEGREQDVRSCIYCNNCLRQGRGSCSVNPFLYREGRLPVTPAEQCKRVMVVGGGLAGMQAAVILAQRGHQVSLWEKDSEMGGQWNTASAMPGKKEYAGFSKYLIRLLRQHQVALTLNTEVTKEKVLEMGPEVVVVATGAMPCMLNVPGVTGGNVVQAVDVIKGNSEVKGRTVIIGGRFIGMELAIWLAEQGKDISLVSRAGLGENGQPLERFTYRVLARRLIDLRVPMYLHATALEITGNSIIINFGDGVFPLAADTVILAVGSKPDKELAQELEGVVSEIYVVGDCNEPHDAASAVYDAARVALKI